MTTTRHPLDVGRGAGIADRLVRTAPFAPGALLLLWSLVRAVG